MDELRARAYLDLLLGRDSRPGKNGTASPASGFAGRVTLTVPLATLAWPAGRPGEIPGIGPVDPWLAHDLAAAAARNPNTTWCVTATDAQGHAVAHGCARPEPKRHRKRAGPGFSFTPAAEPGTWRLRVLDSRPAPGRDVPVDHPDRPPVHHRIHPVSHMTEAGGCLIPGRSYS